MLLTLIKGIIIGIIVSAPMGPTGMLCVRRTLTKGHYHGLMTGFGATLSDLFYASITLLGVSTFIDFINDHSETLQLFGSLFIVAFAIYLIRSKPTLKKPISAKAAAAKSIVQPTTFRTSLNNPLLRDFTSGFFITLGNMLIVLLYIGLFAQFSFLTHAENNYIALVAGLFGIAIGATLWWTFVTSMLIKLKDLFNYRGVRLLNQFIGYILLLGGLIGSVSAIITLI